MFHSIVLIGAKIFITKLEKEIEKGKRSNFVYLLRHNKEQLITLTESTGPSFVHSSLTSSSSSKRRFSSACIDCVISENVQRVK